MEFAGLEPIPQLVDGGGVNSVSLNEIEALAESPRGAVA